MNYRHIYHAGNFADVSKHISLLALLEALKKKATPFCYLETHAGAGLYDLTSTQAQKTKEYQDGINKIWHAANPPHLIRTYLAAIAQHNDAAQPFRFYPGSPLFAKSELRAQDRMVLCELEDGEYQSLKKLFAHDKQVACHHQDGFHGLKAHLPPKEKRGLILMDAAFEKPDEFTLLLAGLETALARFAHGVYSIWYPIKDKILNKRFLSNLKNTLDQEILIVELSIYPEFPQRLTGSGMAIINPPWQLKETLQESLSWVWKTLTINEQGGLFIYFLK